MAIREYQCVECGHTQEKQMPIEQEIPQTEACEKCHGIAKLIMSLNNFILVGPYWPGQRIKRGLSPIGNDRD